MTEDSQHQGKRYFDPEFEQWLRSALEERARINKAKAAGTYRPAPSASSERPSEPPSIKQLRYLKSLGCEIVPNTKAEASTLISQFRR